MFKQISIKTKNVFQKVYHKIIIIKKDFKIFTFKHKIERVDLKKSPFRVNF